jgi:hypothetical protein
VLNAYSPVHYKAFAFILSPHLLSTTSAHACYKQCCLEAGCYSEVLWRCWRVLGVHNPQSIACGVGASVSRIELYNSDRFVTLFMLFYGYCYCYSLLSTICTKLDPGMHIVMHLVFFGKTGGTPFVPTLHLHQCKSSRNLHLQYSAKSQSTPRCQSLITARSDHPSVLGCSGPHVCVRSMGEPVPVWLSVLGDVHLVVKDWVAWHLTWPNLSYNHLTVVCGNGLA